MQENRAMRTNKFRFAYRLIATLATLCLTHAAVAAEYLDLAQEPLFSGTNAVPNVLIAVDDSGSMDMETLFPTDDGWLYWNNNAKAGADGDGNFYNNGDTYGYVYPFDQILPQALTIPPIPEMAYARSATYNKAYFDPSETYEPWLGYPPATEPCGGAKALYDPNETDCAKSIDLSSAATGNFAYKTGMVIPGNQTQPTIPNGVQPYAGQVCYRSSPKDIRTPDLLNLIFIKVPYCRDNRYQLYDVDDLPTVGDETIANDGTRNVSYYPASFYVEMALPTTFGYSATPREGLGPDGQKKLIGYEIKRNNFDSDAQYQTAMQNFANWFTYHRKRHLATRGGIVSAFDRIGDIRVGSCTINDADQSNPPPLGMKDLNDPDQRSEFYSDIFDIPYSVSLGTPNRQALDFLGSQLETNTSIITAPCQRNFAILFTDGYSGTGLRDKVGNVDDNYGKPFSDGYSNTIADIAMKYYQALDAPYEGILRAPSECDKPNPDPRLDCETDLHMTTFGVTLNQSGTLFNTENEPNPFANPDSMVWPNVNTGGNDKVQVDDLWHATINSRGELLNASTPAEIADRFTTALERILGEEGSGSGISLASSSFATDSLAYQASFIAGAWSGELRALPQTSDGGLGDPQWRASSTLSDDKHSNFTAPANRTILTNVRQNCSANNSYKAVEFRFDDIGNESGCLDLTRAKVDYLRGVRNGERANGGEFRNRNSNILGDIVHSTPLYVGAPNRVRYPADWNDLLRDGNETTPEDTATPYYSPKGDSYALNADRTKMVYVGANDGMLHGFDAQTGAERLAFIPGALLGAVGELTEPNYRHRYYVDESPTSGDVIIGNEWRTVLVGGLGAGGRSIYALDVSDPANFSGDPDDVVLWEYQNEELGNTFGKPAIVRLHNGRWAAVFGNGYNSRSGSAQLFIVDIANGKLIQRIDTGAKPASTNASCALDVDLGVIDIGVICRDGDGDGGDEDEDDNGQSDVPICFDGQTRYFAESAANALVRNGRATRGACGGEKVNGLGEVFPVDLDGDFITDYIYAGDLRGNMWRFDLTSASSNGWSVGLDGNPLFTATDSSGAPQPITAQPQVAVHPYGINYGAMVYFGTGKYLETDDREARTQQLDDDYYSIQNSFYGIQDIDLFTFNNANGGKGTYATSLVSEIPRNRLQGQQITETVVSNSTGAEVDPVTLSDEERETVSTYRLVSDNEVDYQTTDNDTSGKRGWYIDLPVGQGELIATNAQVRGNTVSFSTTIPNTEQCTASGSGYFMLVDRRTGGRTQTPAFDLNGDKQLNVADDSFARKENGEDIAVGASGLLIKQGIPNEASYQAVPGSDVGTYYLPDSSGKVRIGYVPLGSDRRRSWREIRR